MTQKQEVEVVVEEKAVENTPLPKKKRARQTQPAEVAKPVSPEVTKGNYDSTTTYGNKDVMIVIEKCADNNIPVLLMGETGTGKTTMVRTIAEKKQKQLIRLNMNGQTGREEFVGKYTLIGGETVRQDGPLVNAMRNGHWLLVDEINVALPEILFVMQSILEVADGKLGKLLLSEKDGEIVIPHEDFRVFATANPADSGYVGTKDLNSATVSRFAVIDVPVLEPRIERMFLQDRFPTLDNVEIFSLVNLAANLRDYYRNKHINYFCSTRDLVYVCTLLSAGLDKSQAIKCCIYDKVIGQRTKEKVGQAIRDTAKITYGEYQKILTEVEQIVDVKLKNEELQNLLRQVEVELNDSRNAAEVYKNQASMYTELKERFDAMINIYQNNK